MRIFVNIVIICVISALLVLPVVVLFRLTEMAPPAAVSKQAGNAKRTPASRVSLSALIVVILFTILFSATMAGITSAARQEIFAASAAYCAILVVFIGNLNDGSD